MTSKLRQKPLLDLWQAPDGAGKPVGVLASTFVIEPDFFERNCLARFLSVQSVDEGTGSVEDVVAQIELEEKLSEPSVAVLADRSAQGDRLTLRWNLLHCHVGTGLMHSKVSILLWENATRIIVGSANLTPAGYRYNLELMIAADFGENCILPRDVLDELADEFESYLDLVPGLGPQVPSRLQAERILVQLRARIAEQPRTRPRFRVALAPTNANLTPLERLPDVFAGNDPLSATQLSPYWDSANSAALESVSALLTGRPAIGRRHDVAVVVGPTGEVPFPEQRTSDVGGVYLLEGVVGDTPRVLHAKCLLIQNREWVSALIGSSNHTAAGLGLSSSKRHRELNLWLGAPAASKEGAALKALIPLGSPIAAEPVYETPVDEDEPEMTVSLPTFFTLCRAMKGPGGWKLSLGFASNPPSLWTITTHQGKKVIDEKVWIEHGRQEQVIWKVETENIPPYLTVAWSDGQASWVVLADNRHDLPPGPRLADIRSSQLLDALGRGKPLSQVVREHLEDETTQRSPDDSGVITDPLKRFDSHSTLLRRGRALANSLTALERRLARHVNTVDALEARLKGPLGPSYLATRVVDDFEDGQIGLSEALFTVAEIALSVSRVDWDGVLPTDDRPEGRAAVRDTVRVIDALRVNLGNEPPDLAGYAARALQEAKKCTAT
ncbi:hypothetical protein [Gordonia sp. ABSL49_1]|uniref:hypothetical protein n=1 Tax=Gordonia sp. ABSL49_1 TaxID=2920941 RepID=UPI001F0FB123|nr:hypothetical protein [Gordonia sp. ABSL49_1]MCH5642274.1 hypothetical protein [Gordonia sp. ABSL49_1]